MTAKYRDMHVRHPQYTAMKKQSGAALVLSLILLAVLTIFAISSIGISNDEEVMTRNTLGYKVALTSAEAALKDGIEAVVNADMPANCGNFSDTSVTCGANQYYEFDAAASNINLANETKSYWRNRASEIQSVSDPQLAAISGSTSNIPQRIVTHRDIDKTLDTGRDGVIVQSLYEVTSVGRDKYDKSQVVIRQNLIRSEVK